MVILNEEITNVEGRIFIFGLVYEGLIYEAHHYEEMKYHVVDDEIRECFLITHPRKLEAEAEDDTQKERAMAGDEAGDICVEWASFYEVAADELEGKGEDDVDEIGIDDLNLLGGDSVVHIVECFFLNNNCRSTIFTGVNGIYMVLILMVLCQAKIQSTISTGCVN